MFYLLHLETGKLRRTIEEYSLFPKLEELEDSTLGLPY